MISESRARVLQRHARQQMSWSIGVFEGYYIQIYYQHFDSFIEQVIVENYDLLAVTILAYLSFYLLQQIICLKLLHSPNSIYLICQSVINLSLTRSNRQFITFQKDNKCKTSTLPVRAPLKSPNSTNSSKLSKTTQTATKKSKSKQSPFQVVLNSQTPN